MIDPRALVDAALTADTPAALGLTLLAGLITSVGPCVAPRYIAISAIAASYRHPIVPTLMFIAGLLCTFTIVGFGSSMLGSLWALSTPLYALLAVGLVCAGCATLVRAGRHQCSHEAGAADFPCERTIAPTNGRRSAGGIFLLGATSALIISPCCTPFIAGIVAAAAATGKPVLGMLLLVSFALGHALPLLFAGNAGSLLRGPLRWRMPEQTSGIVAGTLLLALGAFYGVLA